MKLLNEFDRQIKKFKQLKKVWLTSFNINIEFIEKYILPTVLKMDIPKTRMDYEALQIELNNSGIDFRVFCDKRFMGLDGNKRTAIPIHGISPRQADQRFSDQSIFHAKVIYLEGGTGESSIIGSGSANLTVDGWGRNQEVFHFHRIQEKPIQDSVRSFFTAIFASPEQEHTIASRKNLKHTASTAFCHSFQSEPFLQQLATDDMDELSVWSPYFPGDLAAFIDRLKAYFKTPDLNVNIVPDLVDGLYMRTPSSEALDQKLKKKELKFFSRPIATDDRTPLCHAKLWKTKKHLAIGSWNFTNAGSNIALTESAEHTNNSNIEAGFIIRDNKTEILGKAMPAKASSFANLEQMQEEALEVPDALPFDLDVTFNWSDLTYRIRWKWHDQASSDKGYCLKLPGLKPKINLRTEKYIVKKAEQPERLLADHTYEVLQNSRHLTHGVIIEEQVSYRRPQHYQNLRGLIDGVITGREDDADTELRIVEDDAGQIFVDGRLLTPEADYASETQEEISFFRLFSATYEFANTLRSIKYKKDLDHWTFQRPGCLEELLTKTKDRINNNKSRTVFDWFLAKEVTELIKLAKKQRTALGSNTPKTRWQGLSLNIPKMPIGTNRDYTSLVEKQYNNRRRYWGEG